MWDRLKCFRTVSSDRLPWVHLIFFPANEGLNVVLHQTLVTVFSYRHNKRETKNCTWNHIRKPKFGSRISAMFAQYIRESQIPYVLTLAMQLRNVVNFTHVTIFSYFAYQKLYGLSEILVSIERYKIFDSGRHNHLFILTFDQCTSPRVTSSIERFQKWTCFLSQLKSGDALANLNPLGKRF